MATKYVWCFLSGQNCPAWMSLLLAATWAAMAAWAQHKSFSGNAVVFWSLAVIRLMMVLDG